MFQIVLRLVLAGTLWLLPNGYSTAQLPSQPPFATATTAVIVDAVVRDRKGNPVADLQKDDFELFEDGVRQQIADVTIVAPGRARERGGGTAPAASSSATSTPDARRAVSTPAFVALVFDRLSPEARALAHRGALTYLETAGEGDFAGVFLADRSLVTIQTYTNDRTRLRRAIDDVATRATSVFDRDSVKGINELINSAAGDSHPSTPEVASPESVGRPVDAAAGTGRIPPALLTSAMFNTWEALSRERQGYATSNALLAIASALGMLPGRKTVVFFAEGLAIPDAVLPHFQNVVTTANRANVSFYTVDAGGLRVHSKDAEIGRTVRAAGDAGLKLTPDGSSQSNLGVLEANEDALRKDPRTSLTLLAEQTGGFLVENTNDLARAFRRIDADRRFHYLLTYTPKRNDFGGEWRTVTVTVPSREVTVRARSGYLAVRSLGAIPLLAYEGPALAALDRTPPPRDIALRAGVHVFPRVSDSQLTVLASTRGADLTFVRDEKNGTFRADFTILARIRNSAGEIVRKSSQPYRLSGPLAQLAQTQQGEVLFFRQPTLSPGTYLLDVAVHDALAGRAGVHTVSFEVPESSAALNVSSLMIVRRGERVPATERPEDENPLYVGNVLLYPNLEEPIRRVDKAVTLFFIVSSKGSVPKEATLEVIGEGRILASVRVKLDAADSGGRIRQLAQLPISALTPGEYTLRLIVTHGRQRALRVAQFRLME